MRRLASLCKLKVAGARSQRSDGRCDVARKEEWTDSDKQKLDEIIHQKEIDDAISARRKARADTIKAYAQWIAAVSVAGGVIWDGLLKLADFVRAHIR